MPDDQHPADGLINDIRGLFNGSTFVNGIRDAWDRHFGPASTPQGVDSDNPEAAAQTKANDDNAVRTANESFRQAALNQTQAAKVRAKASGKLGK